MAKYCKDCEHCGYADGSYYCKIDKTDLEDGKWQEACTTAYSEAE